MGKQSGLEFLNKVKTQMGSSESRKTKRTIKDSDHSRSKQRRISGRDKGYKKGTCIQSNSTSLFNYTVQRHFQLEISLRMVHKLHASSRKCSVSALDLFFVPPTQTSVDKGTWANVRPKASVSDTRPIEFELEVKEQEFLDLAHTLLYVTIQLVTCEIRWIRNRWSGGSKVAPVNLFLHSLFGQFYIDLNGRTISDGSSTYPYQAYLETLLSYGEETKSIHLNSSLFYKVTAGKMDEPDPTKANADANLRLKKHASFTSESKVVDMIGRLRGDIFNQEKYLLDMMKACLRLHCSKNQFCLMCSDTNPKFKVKVLDSVLKVRKAHISSNAYLGITSALKKNTAKYPIRHVIIKSYSVSAGSMSRSVYHVFRNVIPQRVVVGIADNDAFNGAFRKNPFNLKNYRITLCGFLENNEPIPNRPYQTYFSTEKDGEYITAFQSLSTDIAGDCCEHENAISREDFSNGYTLTSFDTSTDLCPKAYLILLTKVD